MAFGYTITSYYYIITTIGAKFSKNFQLQWSVEASLAHMRENLKIDEFYTPNDHIIHIRHLKKTH